MLIVKHERIKRGWSQQELGYRSRVSASDISKIETGRMRPYSGQARRIAKTLGVFPEDLTREVTDHEVQQSR